LWPTTKTTTAKYAGESLAILIVMRMQQYNAGLIA
jgi:hypothetical protein